MQVKQKFFSIFPNKLFSRKACVYCLPTKRYDFLSFHWDFYLDFYLSKVFKVYLNWVDYLTPNFVKQDLMFWILKLLVLVKMVKFETDFSKYNFSNRSLIFLKEAQNLDLDLCLVTIFGLNTNGFLVKIGKKEYLYEQIPLSKAPNKIKFDNKIKFKKFLQKNNYSFSVGQSFGSQRKGLKYGTKLGFPLVTKPVNGSLSKHVSMNIKNRNDLKTAIKIAKIYSPEFVVEKFIPGQLFRVTVIAQKYCFVCQKIATNVTGDGKNNIKELIKIKNQKIQENSSVYKAKLYNIEINSQICDFLKLQNLDLNFIPSNNQKVFLAQKSILSLGCDVVELTEEVDLQTKQIFIELAKILKTQLVGFDILSPDIKEIESKNSKNFCILEANSCPYLDMHQYPSFGKPQNVSKIVWQEILKNPDLLKET